LGHPEHEPKRERRALTPPWGALRWLSRGFDDTTAAQRMSWAQICRRPDCRGRWVALHGCRYDETTGHAAEGALIDVDDDLAALCERVRNSEWKNCAILFCGDA